jgi:hypothetical protein
MVSAYICIDRPLHFYIFFFFKKKKTSLGFQPQFDINELSMTEYSSDVMYLYYLINIKRFIYLDAFSPLLNNNELR